MAERLAQTERCARRIIQIVVVKNHVHIACLSCEFFAALRNLCDFLFLVIVVKTRDHEPVVAKDPPRQAPPKPKQSRPAPAKAAAPKPARSGRSGREARELESQIERLEEELGAVSARLSQPDAYQDHTAVAEDGHRHQQLQVELAHLYREWERRVG